MELFDAILLGIVQGLTEFFPVSSSGHLVIAQHLIAGFTQPGVLFDVILHVGTLFSVLIYFKKDLIRMIRGAFNGPSDERKLGIAVIVGSIPTGIIGITFKDLFESLFESVFSVGIMLIITGLTLFASRFIKENSQKEIKLLDAVIIGIVQGLAIIPGISRSGTTISMGMFRKIDAETAGRFSFILSIPAICGALLLEARHISSLEHSMILIYLAGTFSAFISGVLAIKLLMGTLKSKKFSWFAYYCFLAGGVTLFLN